jgi:hypothetical protein
MPDVALDQIELTDIVAIHKRLFFYIRTQYSIDQNKTGPFVRTFS